MMTLKDYMTDESMTIVWAHRDDKSSPVRVETLVEHAELVQSFFQELTKKNGLNEAVDRLIQHLGIADDAPENVVYGLISDWFYQAVHLHDLGKINPFFQQKKMKNDLFEREEGSGDSNHSLLSSLLYLHIHLKDIKNARFSEDRKINRKLCKTLTQVLFVFAYTISRHHTYLGDVEKEDGELTKFEKQLGKLEKRIKSHPETIRYYRDANDLIQNNVLDDVRKGINKRVVTSLSPFPFYVLVKLLYSTLVACDFYATYTFDTGAKPKFNYFNGEYDVQPLIQALRSTEMYQNVGLLSQHPDTNLLPPIDKLRSQLFLETQQELEEREETSIFYLQAPTGAGKTFISLNLSLQLLNKNKGLNKLIYVFPFNTLVEQTKQTIDKVFASLSKNQYRVVVVNSITPIATEQEKNDENSDPDMNYKEELLQRQMMQYPVTLTSHVNFFNMLFGIGRESNLAYTHLCNSVIVLDEIQSYRNEIWKEIIHFLHTFSKLLSFKVIIMSATLPELSHLVNDPDIVEKPLVRQPEKYFSHPIFRNRVHLYFDLLHKGEIDLSTLLEEVMASLRDRQSKQSSARIIVEFITKKSANAFFDLLRSADVGVPVFELTGDDSQVFRKQVLRKLGKDTDGNFLMRVVILVATQVIEAGVDIDMDVGFKDISMLDSEEQFLGRINRSCLREDCRAYFFSLDPTTSVYKKDKRTELDLRSEKYQQMLIEKDFRGFYELCMARINEERGKANEQNWDHFVLQVQNLAFQTVADRMQLILTKDCTLFIDYHLKIREQEDDSKYLELQGSDVWEAFKKLLNDSNMEYAERKIKLSQLYEKMALFSYSYGIYPEQGKWEPNIYTESIGTFYYVENGERFMEEDPLTGAKRFNRIKYEKEGNSPFL